MADNTIDPKKMLPICLLKVLEEHTDNEHRLTQEEIIGHINEDYGLKVERKAIGRYCAQLRENLEYDINSNREGTCIIRHDLEPSEARLLADSVISNRYIEDGVAGELIEKITNAVSPFFNVNTDNLVTAERTKDTKQDVFKNIEIIDDAINKNYGIIFDLYKYAKGKKVKCENVRALPKCIAFINHRYYLYCVKPEDSEHWPCYPIDNMENIRKDSGAGCRLKMNKDERKKFVDMVLADVPADIEQQCVTFLTSQEIIDRVEEAFGGKDRIRTRKLSKHDIDELARRNPNVKLDIRVIVDTNFRVLKKFLKENPTKVLVEKPRDMQEWFRAELMNAVELNSDSEARQLSSADEQLLEQLSLRGKAIMDRPITMGVYPQSVDGAWAPIEWIPITIKKDRVQLISKYCIDYVGAFEGERKSDNLWKKSNLRRWLNSEFLENSFTEEERKSLLKDELGDSVSLPSLDKIRTINYSSNQNVVEVTPYANEKWKDDFEDVLSRVDSPVDASKFKEYYKKYKTHYCGLNNAKNEELKKAVIVALSEKKPERNKSLEITSMCLRPVIWVKTD